MLTLGGILQVQIGFKDHMCILYQFPERLVAMLFFTGLVSAGLAAPLVGVWVDEHGLRLLCMVFCITYSLSCVRITLPFLPIPLLGRPLGGVSTSILFSAFESWLISSASGIVPTTAGVASNQLVESTKNYAVPFIASGALLILGSLKNDDLFQVKRLAGAWGIVRQGRYRIYVSLPPLDSVFLFLGLTQTCFEGSMYPLGFLWVPAPQEYAASSPAQPLPLGIISSFMISMALGSLLYTAISSADAKFGWDS
ncbi:hypothetical protein K443DRAFT_7666 [Laccaria amethystina LaAM-08-1]|uniref:Uncharacterized protein n=1 Tax=Laccaria amethystina LaAM-08-1 TaxID=1095629 RepID=A0A0C9XFT9_9AGAR|nr:hypothetical protein K443DRAFT_7666 [Laccaria amethystina LaAM-08-1]